MARLYVVLGCLILVATATAEERKEVKSLDNAAKPIVPPELRATNLSKLQNSSQPDISLKMTTQVNISMENSAPKNVRQERNKSLKQLRRISKINRANIEFMNRKLLSKQEQSLEERRHRHARQSAADTFAKEYSKKHGRNFFFFSQENVSSSLCARGLSCNRGVFNIVLIGAGKRDNQTNNAAKKDNQTNHAVKKDNQTNRAVKQDYQTNRAVKQDDQTNRAVKQDDQTSRAVKQDDQTNHAVKKDNQTNHAVKKDNQTSRAVKQDDQTNRAVKQDDQTNRAVKQEERYTSLVKCRGVVYEIGIARYPKFTTRIVSGGMCMETTSPFVLATQAAKMYAATYDKQSKARVLYVLDAEDLTHPGAAGGTWMTFGVKLEVRGKDGSVGLVACRDIVVVIPLVRTKGIEFKNRGYCKPDRMKPWDFKF